LHGFPRYMHSRVGSAAWQTIPWPCTRIPLSIFQGIRNPLVQRILPSPRSHTHTPTTRRDTMTISISTRTVPTPSESWEIIRSRKLSARDALLSSTGWLLPSTSPLIKPVSDGGPVDVTSVPARCGLLTPREIEITETDGHVLVGWLTKGEVKSVDVVTAFCKRATIAHQLVRLPGYVVFSLPLTTLYMYTPAVQLTLSRHADKLPNRDPLRPSPPGRLPSGRPPLAYRPTPRSAARPPRVPQGQL
jgi:hypothetical protein